MARALRIALVAGEASGDMLGASLLDAFTCMGVAVEAFGVGGEAMKARGFRSFFDQADIAVMGLGPVLRRLPLLIRRIQETAGAIAQANPDILVTIDAPDFSKRVAKRVRRMAPDIPAIHWVCPSIWAWRPGRAPAMRPYIDHVLCLLPFEPEALARLGGPPGTYIGHPLIEQTALMRPQNEQERLDRAHNGPLLLLPGSRISEIERHLPLFLSATDALGVARVIPTLPRLEARIRALAGRADLRIVTREEDKHAAFRSAHAALAASGTVTLELALAGIPTVAAYRVAAWEAFIARRLITLPSVILPNLVLGEKIVPEFLQEAATPQALGASVETILNETPERAAQIAAFARLDARMRGDGAAPSRHAARVVLDLARKPRD